MELCSGYKMVKYIQNCYKSVTRNDIIPNKIISNHP